MELVFSGERTVIKTVWVFLGAIALSLGAGLGAMLGSVNLTQGTTLAVVTGMGAVLSSGWLSRRFLHWVEERNPEIWAAVALRTGFILGAINLAVAMVLGPISVWRVVWPEQDWPWILIGGALGGIGAGLGGLIAAQAVSAAE